MYRKQRQFQGIVIAIVLVACTEMSGQEPAGKPDTLPAPRAFAPAALPSGMDRVRSIDLPTALRLAGVYNPEINLARERILEAVALRQFAAAQILPNVNFGADVNHHQGPLQQSTGKILDVDRDSLYVGLGAGVVGAGTVNIPGISWNVNASELYFNNLVQRQLIRQRTFESEAVRNEVLLRVASAYLELLRAQARQAVAMRIRDDAVEVARVTANFAEAGQGREADAQRAAAERDQRKAEVVQAENDIAVASARLCELLSLDPAVRLFPEEGPVVPHSLVPEPIPLPELIVIALMQRPELQARQVAIRSAFLLLRQSKVLPFSPQLTVGYSAGDFGGGSNLVSPRFGNVHDREDVDVVLYWSLRNLGVGNLGLIRLAQSQVRQAQLSEVSMLDRVRAEVASASARVQARARQIDINESAAKSSQKAFEQDLFRTRNKEGLPIEVLDSLRLLARSRTAYVDAIVDYNRAHFELYVALGQPPAAILARPVPAQAGAPEAK